MAIPGILLAIALMAVTRASLTTVIVAITVPEIHGWCAGALALAHPARAALCRGGARGRHALAGDALAPCAAEHAGAAVVQATFVAASAVLIEASLSFLGVGIPAQTPSWGNMMAEGRNVVAVASIILYPGILLAMTVLSINMVGDGLRDALDPRLARQL
jgi:peptide/nickel transport system permease protein